MANSHLAGVSATICDFHRQSSRAAYTFSPISRAFRYCIWTSFSTT